MSTLKHLICNVIKIDVLRIKKLKVYCINLLKIMPTLCIFFSLNWICSSWIHSLKHGLVKRPKWYIRFHNTFLSTVLVTFVIGARIPLKYYFKIWTQSSWIQWIKNFNEQHWTCWLRYKYSRPWEIHRSYITDKGLSLFFPLPSKSNGTCKSLVPSIKTTLSHLRPWFWEQRTKWSLAIYTKSLTL